MKRNCLLLILALVCSGVGFGQGVLIRGQVIDKRSKQPVFEANISFSNGINVSTGMDGKFTIKVENFPIQLNISHVAYEKRKLELAIDPKKFLIIELDESLSTLGEVQISAKKTTILTAKDDFSLQDFACEQGHLWLLGYLNNEANRGRLWLSNCYGDTITSVPVQNPKSLFTDVFGNVHLILRDSVYQVYTEGNNILIAYAYSRTGFFQMMAPIKAVFNGRLVYQDFLLTTQGLQTYFVAGDDHQPQLLNIARDSAEEDRVICDYIYGENMTKYWEARAVHCPDKEDMIKAQQYIREHKLTKNLAINHKVKAPVFSVADTLYILNLYKDSLDIYDPAGKYNRSISIKFHRDSVFFGVNYEDISYLTDPLSNKAYVLQMKTASMNLSEIDLSSGKLKPIPLPDLPGMTGIKVYGQAAYFLYPEKKYPYYVRLHRYNL